MSLSSPSAASAHPIIFSGGPFEKEMFFLSEIEHTLRLPPYLLNRPLNEAIKGELDSLFLDKVIEKLGLCVSVYDILSINGGFVFPGDGASTYTVKFRLVMFRPFVGEVISARLKESTLEGLQLSLGFFEDIYVPVPLLPSPNISEPDSRYNGRVIWKWKFKKEAEEGEEDKEEAEKGEEDKDAYPIDGTAEIRFRVHSVNCPPAPLELVSDSDETSTEKKDLKPFSPMMVTGSIDGDGLGPVSWWQ